MPRAERAKQFAPFDALKGLREALKLKEYQHERIVKGELSEEKATELSKTLINLEKGDEVVLTYFEDGHNKKIVGALKLLVDENKVEIERKKILLDDILDIEVRKK